MDQAKLAKLQQSVRIGTFYLFFFLRCLEAIELSSGVASRVLGGALRGLVAVDI